MPPDTVTLHILNTGWATAPEWILMRHGRRKRIRVPALVGLMHHPRAGWGLFDTGYAPRVLDATRHGLFRLYRVFAPMTLTPTGSVVAQLPDFGITAADIAWIVVSHFHADHIGGLADFGAARYIAARSAFDDVRARQGVRALLRAFVPPLVPRDFDGRVTLLDTFAGPQLPPFGTTHDLFGDGSVLLCNVPGHARGQIAVHARTTRGAVLLAADACWLSQSYRENRPAHWLTGVFVDSLGAARRSVAALHAFSLANTTTAIIPTHCPEACERFVVGSGA